MLPSTGWRQDLEPDEASRGEMVGKHAGGARGIVARERRTQRLPGHQRRGDSKRRFIDSVHLDAVLQSPHLQMHRAVCEIQLRQRRVVAFDDCSPDRVGGIVGPQHRHGRIDRETNTLVQRGIYAEPFALRALGIVREDDTLIDEALSRFDALGLDWYVAQTPLLMRTAGRL